MKTVAIAGSSGLIGKSLTKFLERNGYSIRRFVRTPTKSLDDILIQPQSHLVEFEKLRQVDAIINLAGENIGNKRWTKQQKQQILESRINTTKSIVNGVKQLEKKPSLIISASAIGYYGNRPNEKVDEESSKGSGFLAEVCEAWENEVKQAEQLGIRVLILRIGIVLTMEGGALPKLVKPIRFGIGGWFGKGDQVWSWITLDDLLHLFLFGLQNERLFGVVNAVSPNPVTNRELVKIIAEKLNRPAFLPIPKLILKGLLGEMAQPLLFDSCDVVPKKLLENGFQWQDSTIQNAMKKFFVNQS